MSRAARESKPPLFLRLAGHPLRWRLMTELAVSDYRVRELATRVDEPQNLVSYHLRLLRDGGLVRASRSSFDGRDSYYHLDVDHCAEAFADGGAALHPGLAELPTRSASIGEGNAGRMRVLFVCTGNSARSPIAEALLRHTDPRVLAVSAGNRPKPSVHPSAVRVLRERYGIEVSAQRPRHVDDVIELGFTHVVTLCDRAREACPEFPDQPRRAHWSIPDPAASDAGYAAFERTAAEIDTRVRHLIAALSVADPPEVRP